MDTGWKWNRPLIPALGRRGKQISGFEVSLVYRASSKTAITRASSSHRIFLKDCVSGVSASRVAGIHNSTDGKKKAHLNSKRLGEDIRNLVTIIYIRSWKVRCVTRVCWENIPQKVIAI